MAVTSRQELIALINKGNYPVNNQSLKLSAAQLRSALGLGNKAPAAQPGYPGADYRSTLPGPGIPPALNACNVADAGTELFTLNCTAVIAAGALAINTDLDDFFDATNSQQIVTNNLVPDSIAIESAQLFVSTELAANPVENLAVLAGMFVIERVAGVEQARWSLPQFGMTYAPLGVVTSGAANGVFSIPASGVAVERYFEPTTTYEWAIQTNRAFTSTTDITMTMVFQGRRGVARQL